MEPSRGLTLVAAREAVAEVVLASGAVEEAEG